MSDTKQLAFSAAQIDAILAAAQRCSNRNLLDNWYFANPVDQRGGYVVPPGEYVWSNGAVIGTTDKYCRVEKFDSSGNAVITFNGTSNCTVEGSKAVRGYTSDGYTIDRWKLLGRAHVVTIEAEAITLRKPANTDDFVYMQDFEEATLEFLRGKTATISVMDLNGNVYSKTLLIPASGTLDSDNLHIGDNWWIDLIVASNGEFYIRFVSITKAETILGIQAVKLELGTQQTLAHQDANGNWVLNDPPPDKNMELLKCQRYYQLYSSADKRPVKAVDCRPTMRVDPVQGTIVIDGTTYYYNSAEL